MSTVGLWGCPSCPENKAVVLKQSLDLKPADTIVAAGLGVTGIRCVATVATGDQCRHLSRVAGFLSLRPLLCLLLLLQGIGLNRV